MLTTVANNHSSFFFGGWYKETHSVFILVNLGVDSPPESVL
jgi:hypothetical protein